MDDSAQEFPFGQYDVEKKDIYGDAQLTKRVDLRRDERTQTRIPLYRINACYGEDFHVFRPLRFVPRQMCMLLINPVYPRGV